MTHDNNFWDPHANADTAKLNSDAIGTAVEPLNYFSGLVAKLCRSRSLLHCKTNEPTVYAPHSV